MIQLFGDLIHLLVEAENNTELGHEANREEKIMYLEANKDGECKTSDSKNTNHSKPAIETISQDSKIFDGMHLENSAPISRYSS